jgi:hypothetical protein
MQLASVDNFFEEYMMDTQFAIMYGLDQSLKTINKYCYIVLTVNVLALYYILKCILRDRQIGTYGTGQLLLRILFTFIIYFLINSDK